MIYDFCPCRRCVDEECSSSSKCNEEDCREFCTGATVCPVARVPYEPTEKEVRDL